MRLIDVDVYCATICRCYSRECDKAKCPIHNTPTSYSVDKVVEELEKLKDKGSVTKTERLITKACFDKAIEIVKQSGVSDDVCEWKLDGDNLTTGCGDYFNLYDNCTGKFKYCPRCGKKIKVVE